jgi:hypothetical protein
MENARLALVNQGIVVATMAALTDAIRGSRVPQPTATMDTIEGDNREGNTEAYPLTFGIDPGMST